MAFPWCILLKSLFFLFSSDSAFLIELSGHLLTKTFLILEDSNLREMVLDVIFWTFLLFMCLYQIIHWPFLFPSEFSIHYSQKNMIFLPVPRETHKGPFVLSYQLDKSWYNLLNVHLHTEFSYSEHF